MLKKIRPTYPNEGTRFYDSGRRFVLDNRQRRSELLKKADNDGYMIDIAGRISSSRDTQLRYLIKNNLVDVVRKSFGNRHIRHTFIVLNKKGRKYLKNSKHK